MKTNIKIKMDDATARRKPDIFRAAQNDDLGELARALDDGQSLSEQRPQQLNMTPLHVACLSGSNLFIAAASEHETFDPWIRDDNLRLAFDHAYARNNKSAMRLLHSKMYPPDWADEAEVVSLDKN